MIRIISDSSTLYTIEEGKQLNIDIAPLSVTINNETYREYEDITQEEFYELIKQGHLPTSSQPPVGLYLELFEKYQDDDIIVICMADGLSGTYQSCVGAKAITKRDNIHVINSKTLCIPHRQMVNEAVKMRDSGATLDEILTHLETLIESTESFLLPQDFDYLKRGGRLTPLAAKLSGLIKIQPVLMQTKDGMRLERFAVSRSFNSAVKKVLDHFETSGVTENTTFGISHAFAEKQAHMIAEKIKERFNTIKVEIEELSCAFITQGGPLCVAIQKLS